MKTINLHSFRRGGTDCLDRCELQKLIGISNRGVWRKWLIAVGFNPDDLQRKYHWSDIPILIALKLFLNAKKGRHKHTYLDFLDLRESDQLSEELLTIAKQLTEDLRHDYQNKRLAS